MKKWALLLIFIVIFGIASWLRLHDLGNPPQFLFDEDLYVYTANLIRQGDPKAFEWWHPPDTNLQSSHQYRPPAVEWLHPPLSKYAIAKSIVFFGDQPWAWRLPSALAGIGVVVMVGWLAHSLFGRWSITLLATCIAAIEPFLVVQSRLASADIFVALFTTATLASFVQWQRGWRWGLPIAGILAGLAVASKWSGGLIILAMVVLLLIDYFHKRKTNRTFSSKQSVLRSLLFPLFTICFLPFIIYAITYLPAIAFGHSPTHIIELHRQSWQYHSTNRAVHPNSSPAFLWLINQKPVWYYFNQQTGQSIVAKGSPVVLLGGLLALGLSLLSLLAILLDRSNKRLTFTFLTNVNPYPHQVLLISFLCLWAPWLLVQRPTFLYHYLPCVPLLLVLLSFWLVKSIDYWRNSLKPHHPSK